ncbi:hypothetical protein Pla52o_20670 [Novipirellula galeiformis]|uniref:IncA protein n=1 Tax=Novipirellula galeiformis TaxID=2528004 RepID=A0A5C6CGV8_9BACT|nr:hypothetical protein [Novipirellula galeiformis]TWU24143.1 hypothetical protein Pla52o_20670 [Novipirellula galeiformis]
MARRPRTSDDDISLFPFLSIIASVIGVLTMMIATLALAQTDTPDIAQIEQFEKSQKELDALEDEVEELKREIEVSDSTGLKLREEKKLLNITLAELESLLKEQEEIDKALAEQEKIKVVIPMVNEKDRETAGQMKSELESLQEELAQLEKEAAERAEASQSNVTVLPQGSGLNFVPHFVECAEGAIVMHHLQPAKRIRAAEMAKDADFIALLEKTLNGKDDTIVFLVRSDGLSVYRSAKKMCDDREIRNGKIPVVGKGRIDLSAFANPQNVTGEK